VASERWRNGTAGCRNYPRRKTVVNRFWQTDRSEVPRILGSFRNRSHMLANAGRNEYDTRKARIFQAFSAVTDGCQEYLDTLGVTGSSPVAPIFVSHFSERN
jgi:hypothetical protein